MDTFNSINLLHSNIVIGMHSNVNPSLTFTDNFHKWLHHKDTDWGMEDFKSRNTLYVGFLHIIDLSVLKQIFYDLASIYKKQFSYAIKQDFINYTFGYTIWELERFISQDLRFLGSPTIDSPFEYYYCFLTPREIIDFAIPTDSSIEHYKQYYRQVINLINDIPYNTTSPVPFNNGMPKISINTDKSESKEIRNLKSDKKKFSILQWATIFYYAEDSELLPRDNTKKNQMQQFIYEHPFDTTVDSFKNKYSMAMKRINATNDYPIKKLEMLIPYLEENYPETIGRVQNDLKFLKEEKEKLNN